MAAMVHGDLQDYEESVVPSPSPMEREEATWPMAITGNIHLTHMRSMALVYANLHDGVVSKCFKHEFYFPFHIWDVILPIDFHIFQRGRSTTNQLHSGDFVRVNVGKSSSTMVRIWDIYGYLAYNPSYK